MKRVELIKRIGEWGLHLYPAWQETRLVQNPVTKMAQPVPKHNEIKDSLAKHILKMLKS